MKTEEYAKQKICNGLAGEMSLASTPQLRTVRNELLVLVFLCRWCVCVGTRCCCCAHSCDVLKF
jgi:hypothetical protein